MPLRVFRNMETALAFTVATMVGRSRVELRPSANPKGWTFTVEGEDEPAAAATISLEREAASYSAVLRQTLELVSPTPGRDSQRLEAKLLLPG